MTLDTDEKSKKRRERRRGSTFVQDVPQRDPLPGDGDVFHFGFGLDQGDAAQVVLLDAERRVRCQDDNTPSHTGKH